jgi:hypothetical protein
VHSHDVQYAVLTIKLQHVLFMLTDLRVCRLLRTWLGHVHGTGNASCLLSHT